LLRTANALNFQVYLLAKYQQIQKKLREEIKETVKDFNFNDIDKVQYLSCVIKESLRLFPPVAKIPIKLTSQDTVLGDFFIPKGSLVDVSIYDIHRDPTYYDNPNDFIPERWSKDAPKKIPHFAWIPFSYFNFNLS
jgi:cytochrome P450